MNYRVNTVFTLGCLFSLCTSLASYSSDENLLRLLSEASFASLALHDRRLSVTFWPLSPVSLAPAVVNTVRVLSVTSLLLICRVHSYTAESNFCSKKTSRAHQLP